MSDKFCVNCVINFATTKFDLDFFARQGHPAVFTTLRVVLLEWKSIVEYLNCLKWKYFTRDNFKFWAENRKMYIYVHAGTNGFIQKILKHIISKIRDSQTFMVSSKFMTGAYRFGCVFRLVFLKEKWSEPTAWKIEKSLGWLHNGACNKKNWPRQFCKITIFVKAVFCLSRLIESSKRQNKTVLAKGVRGKFYTPRKIHK